MGATIDDLQIKLQGDSKSANREIDTVIKNLQNLSTALGGFKSVPGLQSVTKAFNEMKTATNGIDAGKIKSISSSIRSLTSSISSLQSVASKGFGLNRLREDIKGLESIKFDTSNLSGITNLANSISKIGSKTGTTATANLIPMTDNLKRFVTEMNGIQASTFDAESLSRLASSISKIGGIKVTNATTTLPQLTSSLKTFITEMNKVEGVSFNTEGLSNLANSISRLGTKTSTVAVENIPKLQVAIKNLLTDLSKAPAISDNTVRSLEAMANIAQRAGGSFNSANNGITGFTNKTVSNFDKIKNAASKVISAFGKVAVAAGKVTGINRLVNGVQRLVPATNQAEKGFKGLARTITTIYAGSFLATRAFDKLKSGIESAMSYVEAYDYYRNTFNELGKNADLSQWKELGYKSAEEYARSFRERANEVVSEMTGFDIDKYGGLKETGEANLGLNPTKMMQTEAMFGQMANSMGVATETASKLSEVYTKLGADMASAFNMDFAQVYDNLQSGMTGMARAVDKYGVNLRVANLQQQLNELGIKANINKLSQQDKVLLRTIVTLNATTQAWGNLAQTITSPENQIRLLSQNFATLAQMIGSLFLPVISKVLPYINGMVIALKSLVSYIGSLLGVDLSDYMKSVSSIGDNENLSAAYDDADNLADSLDNVGDSADKAAKKQKKFNKQLAAFDELNNYTTSENEKNPKGSSTSSSGAPNVGADLTAALDSAMDKYLKKWNEAFKGMENKASEIADNIKDAFVYAWNAESGYQIGKSLAEFVNKGISWYNKHLPTFKSTAKKIAGILASAVNGAIWNTNWKGLGKAIGGSIKAYLDANTAFYDIVDWEVLGRNLAKSLNSFLDSGAIESYFSNIGAKLRAIIESVFGFTEDFDFKSLGEHIANGLNNLLGKMDKKINGLNGWQKLGKSVSNAIVGALNTGIIAVRKFKWEKLGKGISDGIKSIDFKRIAIKLSNFAVSIFNAVTRFLNSVDWFGVGQKIGDFISNIKWGSVLWNFGKLAVAVIKAIGASFVGTINKAPIETAIIGLFLGLKYTGIGKNLFSNLASKVLISIGKALQSAASSEGLATAIGNGLKVAAKAVPYAAVAAVIAGSLYEGYKIAAEGKIAGWKPPTPDFSKTKKAFSDLAESIGNLKTSAHNAEQAISNWNPIVKNVEKDADNLKTLADSYYELATKTNRTKTETEEMKIMAEKLSQKIPGFNKLIDKQTGAYKGTREQLDKLVKKTESYYKIQAAQAQKKKLYSELVELELNLADAEKKLNKARKDNQSLKDEWLNTRKKLIDEGILAWDKYTKQYQLAKNEDYLSDDQKKLLKHYREQGKALDENNKELKKSEKNYKNASKAVSETKDQIKEVDKYEKQATEDMNKNSKAVVNQTKSFKDLSKNAKDLKKQLKNGATLEITAKTSEKYQKVVDKFTKTSSKTVQLLADGKETGDYSKISESFDKWKDGAKKTLTAYMEGKLDKESTKEVFDFWNGLSDEDVKNLRANLTGKQQKDFDDLYSAYKSLKDTTVNVSVSGTADSNFFAAMQDLYNAAEKKKLELQLDVKSDTSKLKSIDDKIKDLQKQKEVKIKMGDLKGAQKVQRQIDKLNKKKVNIQASINVTKVKLSWAKLLQNDKNLAKLPTDAQNAIRKALGLATGGIFKGGKWQPVTRYAGGGLPTQGQYFIAREAGPELVGTIGNHTAVMNNDQIVASVSDGVAKALAPAINQMTNTLLGMQGNSGSVAFAGEVPVYIDGREVFRAVGNQNDDFKRRTGRSRF